MAEKPTVPGEPSNPERDEALKILGKGPLREPMSDEDFEAARKRLQEEEDLPVHDPVEAEHMAHEMNPLTRADERFRVQDPVEAEHMAHAMDTHYERASEIEGVKDRTDKELDRTFVGTVDDDVDPFPPEGAATQEERSSAMNTFEKRADSLISESTSLEDAASSARKAGDAHGEQVSRAYRHKKKESGD
jgi:hypothetical protein